MRHKWRQQKTEFNTQLFITLKKGPGAEDWYIINDPLIRWPDVSPWNNYENVETSAYAIVSLQADCEINFKAWSQSVQNMHLGLVKASQKMQTVALIKERHFYGVPTRHQTLCQGLLLPDLTSFPTLPKSLRGWSCSPLWVRQRRWRKGQSPAEGAQPVTGREGCPPQRVGLHIQSSSQGIGCVRWTGSSGFPFFVNIAFSAV